MENMSAATFPSSSTITTLSGPSALTPLSPLPGPSTSALTPLPAEPSSVAKKGHRRSRSWGLQTPTALPLREETEPDPLEEVCLNTSAPAPSTSGGGGGGGGFNLFPKFPSFGKGKRKKKKGHSRSQSWGVSKELEATVTNQNGGSVQGTGGGTEDPGKKGCVGSPRQEVQDGSPGPAERILSPNVDSGVFSGCGEGTDYQKAVSPDQGKTGKDLNLSVTITPATPEKRLDE